MRQFISLFLPGTLLKQDKQTKLKDLQKNKDEAERIRTEKETLKKEAEKLENGALDYYRKLEEEEKRKKSEEEENRNRVEAKETFERFDSNQDGMLDIPELQTRTVFDKNADGASKNKYFSSWSMVSGN